MKCYHPRTILSAALLVASVAGTPVLAEDAPYADNLTGDWNGARTRLADQGVELSADYVGDVTTVTGGGLKRMTTYMDFLEVRLGLDGSKLYGISGNTISVAVTNTNGAQPNAGNVGSVQGINNGEAENGVRLYEAWMNQEFLDGRIALLVGLHDSNSEFSVTGMSDNFVAPTFQLGQSFAQSGRNAPSAFPATSLAARLKVKPTENTYVAGAVYDGVPGDTDHVHSNPIFFDDKDGLLFIGEVGYVADPEEELNKVAFGYWSYTAKLDDQVELNGVGDPAKNIARGAYLIGSYQFYQDKAAGRKIGGFARGGIADGDTAQIDWDVVAGLVADGWVPGRSDGQFGLGVSQAHNSDKYKQAQLAAATPAESSETIYELYYLDKIYRGVTVQPSVQYVVNPGTNQTTDDAAVLGMRLGVSF
jgi:porin